METPSLPGILSKKSFTPIVCAAIFTMATVPASAVTITDTLPEFNFDGEPSFPTAEQIVGVFSYAVPIHESIVSASVSGTFGNSTVSSSAPVEMFVDGVFLGECLITSPCYQVGLVDFSFDVPNLGDLMDGSLTLSIVQTNQYFTRLGVTTLTIETTPTPIPATAWLFGSGLLGLVGIARRKKAA
jgi:hypothetical protein